MSGRSNEDLVRSKVVQLFQVQNFQDIITLTKVLPSLAFWRQKSAEIEKLYSG